VVGSGFVVAHANQEPTSSVLREAHARPSRVLKHSLKGFSASLSVTMYWRSSGRADPFEDEPQVADDRVVAQDGMTALPQIPARHPGQASADQGGQGSPLHAEPKSRSASAL
jgi:hypothetical protein